MKVGMHVGVGYVDRSRKRWRHPNPATEAYILVLPEGRLPTKWSRPSTNTEGKVGLAVNRDGRWKPEWWSSAEVLHPDWNTYLAKVAKFRKDAANQLAESEKRRLAEEAYEARLTERLTAVGIDLTSFYHGKGVSMFHAEALLSLLDEARGVAETMRHERGEDFPLPWEIDTTEEDEQLLTTEATTS